MFIVEGGDYVGKSTTVKTIKQMVRARRWSRRYGTAVGQVQHWGRLDDKFDYCDSYLEAITSGEQIADRFVLSELAYGTAFRKGPNKKFTPHIRRLVARELNRAGSVQILVWSDWKSISRRMKLREDMFTKKKEDYHKLVKAFGVALKDPALGRSGISYLGELNSSDGQKTDDTISWYLEVWKMHLERSIEVTKVAPESWGYLWPKILFVGEETGAGRGARPFAGLRTNGCSQTLSYLLDRANIPERLLYFINSYDQSNNPTDRKIFNKLGAQVIVALGKEAQDFCRAAKVDHVKFPHPQWISRFERKRMGKWIKELKAIASTVLSSSSA